MTDTALACGLVSFAILLLVVSYTHGILRAPVYHPYTVYVAYHFVGFVVRPLVISQVGYSHLWEWVGFTPSSDELWRSTIVANAALLSVTGGLIYSCRNRVIRKLPPATLRVGSWYGFVAAASVLTLAGYYANYRTFYGAGLDRVISYEVLDVEKGGSALVGISGYTTALAETLPILCVTLFLVPRLRSLAIAFTAAFVGFRFFAGAQRLSFVVVVAAIVLIIHVNKGYRYPRFLPLIGVLCFAFMFDVVGHDRFALRKILHGTTSVSEVLENYVSERGSNRLTSDVVEFDVATSTIAVVDAHRAYSYGSQYLRLLVWPIPRQIWPEKPVLTNVVDLNRYGNFRYLTTSLYGDVYMIFGLTLVPILFFLLGLFFGRLYQASLKTRSALGYLFYWIVLMYMQTLLRDGGVSFLYFWAFSLVPALLIVKMGRVTIKRSGPLPPVPTRRKWRRARAFLDKRPAIAQRV